jgi:hypothetical protein
MFRTARTVSLALAGAALVAAPAAAQAASASTQKPVLITCGRGRVAEPRGMVLACADDGIGLEHLRWSSWGGNVAHATGTGYVNTCTPSCVNGTIVRYRVRVDANTLMQTGAGAAPVRVPEGLDDRDPAGLGAVGDALPADPVRSQSDLVERFAGPATVGSWTIRQDAGTVRGPHSTRTSQRAGCRATPWRWIMRVRRRSGRVGGWRSTTTGRCRPAAVAGSPR